MEKALLVIDMQNFCVGKNQAALFKYKNLELIKNVNMIISEYEPQNVYYIVNIMEDNLSNKCAPFKAFAGSYEADIVSDLSVVNNKIFKKYESNAFSNKKLIEELMNSNITEVEIVGVDGGGCVALTAFAALELGFKVIMNTRGIGTTFNDKADKYNKQLKEQGVQFK
ncbi:MULTISPECIES: isochorismatase family protein [unclassified Clostridium]|uniref:isochorismatase family protein n=1 Tax=Clostridium TaxID=1485 RepID=UPI0013FBED74|nr:MULTISPECIES: isochorismatase family protein [unclassified Clostridium]NFI56698.1 cysteine hydrolase [Clostridium botulinum]